jgi:hypothetical protein
LIAFIPQSSPRLNSPHLLSSTLSPSFLPLCRPSPPQSNSMHRVFWHGGYWSKRPSAREELGNKRLDVARNLALENKYLISPRDLQIAKEKFTLCVLPLQSIIESCSAVYVSTTEIQSGLGSKKGISKFLQAREYCKSAKDALRFVEVTSHARDGRHHLLTMTISRPCLAEQRTICSDKGRQALILCLWVWT